MLFEWIRLLDLIYVFPENGETFLYEFQRISTANLIEVYRPIVCCTLREIKYSFYHVVLYCEYPCNRFDKSVV